MKAKFNPLEKVKSKIDDIVHAYHMKKKTKLQDEVDKIKKEQKKKNHSTKKNKVVKKRKNLVILKDFLLKAGYEFKDERKFSRSLKRTVVYICGFVTIALLIFLAVFKLFSPKAIVLLIAVWTVLYGLLIGLSWLFVYLYLDVKIYQRTKQVEEVLPDFLQLASANISAGMPIDQALWYAVRPKFGVLAKEIEEVAKSTIAGEDLEEALMFFSKKYDSKILQRSVSLVIEGMRAGGEMADLLSKISIDIQETKLMKKEIAASVMTYVIFISFATIAAAPFLFALSTQLLGIVQTIMGSLDLGGVSTGSFNLSVSGDSIAIGDFKIFSMAALSVSGLFSAAIVSIIRKGNVRDGLKFIPIFIAVSLVLYFIANIIVGKMMGSFI